MENSILFRTALATDTEIISTLANKIWWQTYASFLSEEQITFMLEKMYDPEILSIQINEGINFIIVEANKSALGFVSFMPKENEPTIYRIEKVYLLPESQGLGIGKKLLNYVAEIAKTNACTILELNVNRNNPAIKFYEKVGFKITQEIDIPYHSFVLNDCIMQKSI